MLLVNVNANQFLIARPASDVCDSCTFGHAVGKGLGLKCDMHWSTKDYDVHQAN